MAVKRVLLAVVVILFFLLPVYISPPYASAQTTTGVANAFITLSAASGGNLHLSTDGYGMATALVKEEPHQVYVTAYGHISKQFNVDFSTTTDVELQLDNAPFIYGKVTYANQPVAGAYIMAGDTCITDSQGNYAVPADVSVGAQLDMSVSPMSSMEASHKVMEFAETYKKFMNMVNVLGSPINLTGIYGGFISTDYTLGIAGKSSKVTLNSMMHQYNIALQQGFTISGHVTKNGAPLPNAVVAAFSINGDGYFDIAVTDDNGFYSLGTNIVMNVNYTVVVMAEGCELKSTWVVVNGDVSLDFDLSPSVVVNGVVKDTNGNPLEGYMVTFMKNGFPVTAVTDQNGQFQISTGLSPGTYNVTYGPVDFMLGMDMADITLMPGTNNIELIYDHKIMVLTGTLDDPNRSGLLEPVQVTIEIYITGVPMPLTYTLTLKNEGVFTLYVPYSFGYGGIVVDASQVTIKVGSQYYYNQQTVATITPTSNFDLGTISLSTPTLVEVTIRVVSEPSTVRLPEFKHVVNAMYEGTPYTFVFETNSSLQLAMYQIAGGKGTIIINVGGPTGTSGYLKITVPKAFIAPPFDVKIDNRNAGINVLSENATHVVILIEYSHSLHTVTIESVNAIPEFPIGPLAIMTLIAFVIAILLRKRVI